jgi:hypothetical protein
MVDTLISFETAKLAKEKGFNIPTETCWIETTSSLFKSPFHTIRNKVGYITEGCDYINEPTQSLLQKWFREEHKIDIWVLYNDNRAAYPYFWELNSKNGEYKYSKKGFKTYEEALEQGLIEALKLLP